MLMGTIGIYIGDVEDVAGIRPDAAVTAPAVTEIPRPVPAFVVQGGPCAAPGIVFIGAKRGAVRDRAGFGCLAVEHGIVIWIKRRAQVGGGRIKSEFIFAKVAEAVAIKIIGCGLARIAEVIIFPEIGQAVAVGVG